MKVKINTLRKILREAISQSTQTLAKDLRRLTDDETVTMFWQVYDYLGNYRKVPNDKEGYGEFANQNALLWQADGEIEFLTSILKTAILTLPKSKNALANEPSELLRRIIMASVKSWLKDNGFVVINGKIKKGN